MSIPKFYTEQRARACLTLLLAVIALSLLAQPASAQAEPAKKPVVIEKVQPALFGAGARLVIQGKGFRETHKLFLGTRPLEIKSVAAGRIEARVPERTRRGGALTLREGRRKAAQYREATFVRAPKLIRATPAYASPGGTVTIIGRRLRTITEVLVGDTSVEPQERKARSLRFKVPEKLKSGVIKIRGPGGEARLRRPYEIYRPPTIASVHPDRFGVGTEVVVKGRNFTKRDRLFIGTVRIRRVTRTPTEFRFTVPRTVSRPGALILRRPGRPTVRFKQAHFVLAPRLTSVQPCYARKGDEVRLRGKNLDGVTEVRVGDRAVEVARQSRNEIRFVVDEKVESGVIQVSGPGGQSQTAGPYEIYIPLAVKDVQPREFGPGATLTVIGENFDVNDRVTLDGRVLTRRKIEPDRITVTLPEDLTGGERLEVTRTVRGGSSIGGLSFYRRPLLLRAEPAQIAVGAPLTVIGEHLDGARSLTIAKEKVKFEALDERRLKATAPDRVGRAVLQVTGPGGTARLKEPLFIVAPLRLDKINARGAFAGDRITLSGKYFEQPDIEFRLGKTRLRVVKRSAGQVVVTVPKKARSGPLSASLFGNSVPLKKTFEVYKPVVVRVKNTIVRTPGVIEVRGRNLDSVTRWTIAEVELKPAPARDSKSSATRRFLQVEGYQQASGKLVAIAHGRKFRSRKSLKLTVKKPVVRAVRYRKHRRGAVEGTIIGRSYTTDTVFNLDGQPIVIKQVSPDQATFTLPGMPSAGSHQVVASNGDRSGPVYTFEGEANGYKFAADKLQKLLSKWRLSGYSVDEAISDIAQSEGVFARLPKAALNTARDAGKKQRAREAVRKRALEIVTEMERLTLAQRALCAGMKPGRGAAGKNEKAGVFLARASRQIAEMTRSFLLPLWRVVPAAAWSAPKSAGQLGMGAVDLRVAQLLKARERLQKECRYRYHGRGMVGRAPETANAGLAIEFRKAVEAVVQDIAGSAGHAAQRGVLVDQAVQIFDPKRRAYWGKQLGPLAGRVRGKDGFTGKGVRGTKKVKRRKK